MKRNENDLRLLFKREGHMDLNVNQYVRSRLLFSSSSNKSINSKLSFFENAKIAVKVTNNLFFCLAVHKVICVYSKSPQRRTYFFKSQAVLGFYSKRACGNFRVRSSFKGSKFKMSIPKLAEEQNLSCKSSKDILIFQTFLLLSKPHTDLICTHHDNKLSAFWCYTN